MRLRTALIKSKNLVSVRILQAISPQYAQDYITRFGFDPKLHPPYLTMALGAGNVTPLQMIARLCGLRQRRLPRDAVFHRARGRRRGNVLVAAQTGGGGRGRGARHRRAQRLHHDQHHARRGARGHRRARHEARARRSCRQDRHHQRVHRRVVLRLQRRAGGGGLDRLRHAADARAATKPARRRRCRSGWATWARC